MKPICIASIFLLSIKLARCDEEIDVFVLEDPVNIRMVLNWLRQYSLLMSTPKSSYAEKLKRSYKGTNLSKIMSIDTVLKITDLTDEVRKCLVVGPADMIHATANVNREFLMWQLCILSLREGFEDLNAQIKVWVKEGTGITINSRIHNGIIFEWFVKHGFNRSTLKNLEVWQLQNEVEYICGYTSFFAKVIRNYSTYMFDEEQPKIANKLAWLLRLSSPEGGIEYIKMVLEDETCKINPSMAKELVDSLTQLGADDGPLRKLIGKGLDDGLYTPYVRVYKYAEFDPNKVGSYLRKLLLICDDVTEELYGIGQLLRCNKDATIGHMLAQNDFTIKIAFIDEFFLTRLIDGLIDENGLITKICNLVNDMSSDIYSCNTDKNAPTDDENNEEPESSHKEDSREKSSSQNDHRRRKAPITPNTDKGGERDISTNASGEKETPEVEYGRYQSKVSGHELPGLSFRVFGIAAAFFFLTS